MILIILLVILMLIILRLYHKTSIKSAPVVILLRNRTFAKIKFTEAYTFYIHGLNFLTQSRVYFDYDISIAGDRTTRIIRWQPADLDDSALANTYYYLINITNIKDYTRIK